ncbi:MAG: EAL domain-containing protein [Selenomonadaceae bacterium]|nr:EAL domain-containing protein [Selenomonadaceae bacterium]
MNRNLLLDITKDLVESFYNQGRIGGMLEMAEGGIVTFGAHSLRYYSGLEGMEFCLRQELRYIMPCKILKCSYKYREDDELISVLVTVVIRSDSEPMPIIHRLIFMYRVEDRISGDGVRLTGINITRDVHHEETYRMVCARMFGDRIDEKSLADTSVSLVASYSDCAYVNYQYEDGRVINISSPELWNMLGYYSEEAFMRAAGGYLDTLIPEADKERINEVAAKQLGKRKICQLEYRMRRADGGYIWVLECGRRDTDENGRAIYHSIILNITPLKNTGRSLMRQLSYDDLTGIYNKRAFSQHAHDIMVRKPDTEFEMMRFDIKRFKVINELFGEAVGDNIICYLADFLKHINISDCSYGRLHSDQFIICYPADFKTRDRLISALNTMALSYSIDYRIELAFGIYRIADRHMPMTTMIDRAGIALSKAKNDAVTGWSEYDEAMRRLIVNEQEIINDMTNALKKGEFVVYLQPKYSLVNDSVVGAEALVRWIHPVRGLISPLEFIPVFEHNGFIFELDKYIWEETCRLLRKWIDDGYPALPISINVSRVDFYREDLCDTIEAIVNKYDIPRELIGLEVTESAYTDNPQQIIEITKHLQEMGFRILMDDFGSGYSSLNMLKDMPVDVLKIDLKFLDSHDENGRGGNILNSIVRMSKWLRMQVIAEGVETYKQVEFLRSIGCDQAQGYFYSRPIPVYEYEKLLVTATQPHAIDYRTVSWLDGEAAEKLLAWDSHALTLLNTVNESIGLYEFKDDKLELIRANEGYANVFGEQIEGNINGRDALEGVVPEDRMKLLGAIHRAKEESVVSECLFRRIHADGRILYIHTKARVVASEGSSDYVYMAMTDVTKEREKAMALDGLLRNVAGGIGCYRIVDDRLKVVFVSSWLNTISGREECDVDGAGIDLAEIVGEDTAKVMVRSFKEASRTGKPVSLEYPFSSKTGQDYWLGASLTAEQLENGELSAYAIVYDITDRRMITPEMSR